MVTSNEKRTLLINVRVSAKMVHNFCQIFSRTTGRISFHDLLSCTLSFEFITLFGYFAQLLRDFFLLDTFVHFVSRNRNLAYIFSRAAPPIFPTF